MSTHLSENVGASKNEEVLITGVLLLENISDQSLEIDLTNIEVNVIEYVSFRNAPMGVSQL